ncbi:NADP-dependent oxidoreductase [Listeria costaricensis]|uniref:NADP-dependent oxidoreductase n=1 Tax=Listeria costaricensis TaxID=2026604 RepID=UPI000C069FE5|nr:NADP-dependent oxidoreductase [Listeria costaricensis]
MEQIILKKRPIGLPKETDFEHREIKLKGLHEGELHLRLTYLSVDPYLRGRMNDVKSYVEPFKLGDPIESTGILEVVRSKSQDFAVGEKVIATVPWQKEVILPDTQVRKIDSTLASAPAYLGVIGLTGLTAYFGLLDIGKPQPGETVVVSAGAGAVGSAAGQIAQIKGARVVGIAGSDEKVRYMVQELGFDVGVNYRAKNYPEILAKACPDGIDVYFENVGGPVSDAVWPLLNRYARIPVCGSISGYNKTADEDSGPRIQNYLIKTSAEMKGFTVGNYADAFPEGRQQLIKWLEEGKLTHKETLIHGFDQIIPAFLSLFEGKNIGKIVIEI